jgi:hypothetical protein
LIIGAIIGAILGLLLDKAYDKLTTSEEEATLRRFEQLTSSIYPGVGTQEALDKLCGDYDQLRDNVYLEISLVCHAWKNNYWVLRPELFEDDGQQYEDIWEMLEKAPTPPFTREAWERYRPLFDGAIDAVIARLDQISMMHGEVLAPDFRKRIIDSRRALKTQQWVYVNPTVIAKYEDRDRGFGQVFQDVIHILAGLSREADRRQAEMTPEGN